MKSYSVIDDLGSLARARHDLIIDARSPSEFAEDHLPGAVNLPVLSDAERAEIGTIYKQVSPFEARRKGAGLVAANIAGHLASALSDKPREFRPLVYCWRGGMRSNSFATILSAVGWRASVVEGGYKAWRKAVINGLEDRCARARLILIDGQTGSGKTALLHTLAERGAQMIDLEGLANHRGSAFGALSDQDQPAQKRFESLLWDQMERFDLERPIYIEAESALVGRCRIPAPLWERMKTAPRIEISASAEARAVHTLERYPDMVEDPARIEAALDHLIELHSAQTVAAWKELAHSGAYTRFAQTLITQHYDPAYARARKRQKLQPAACLHADTLDAPAINRLADEILALGR